MQARTERIASLMDDILPHIKVRDRYAKKHTLYIATLVLLCAMFTGYSFNEHQRTVSANEYVTLHALVEYAAQQKAIDQKEMTAMLLKRFEVDNLADLPASKWVQALQFLTRQAG